MSCPRLANSLCITTRSLGLNERRLIGSTRDHVSNIRRIVGVFYACSDQSDCFMISRLVEVVTRDRRIG